MAIKRTAELATLSYLTLLTGQCMCMSDKSSTCISFKFTIYRPTAYCDKVCQWVRY